MGPLKHKGQKNTKKKMDQGYILAFFFYRDLCVKISWADISRGC